MPLALPGEHTSAEIATHLLRHGVQPLPVPKRSKNPGIILGPGWQTFRTTEKEIPAYFKDTNVGFLTGPVSGNLADVDLDCEETLQVADAFLGKRSTMTFGRPGRPRSHRVFRAPGATHMKLQDPDTLGKPGVRPVTLVELRFGTEDRGIQTVIYGEHESGEKIRFSEEDPQDPMEVDGDWLTGAVLSIGAAGLLIRRGASDLMPLAERGELTHAVLLSRMSAESAEAVAEWLGLPKPKAAVPKKQANTGSTDLQDAVRLYNEDNRREYPARLEACEACGSPDGFKQHPDTDLKWCCMSSKHEGVACGSPARGRGGTRFYIGDALDLDAFRDGRKRTEHLRATGYLRDHAKPQVQAEPEPLPDPGGLDPWSFTAQLDGELVAIASGIPRIATHWPELDRGLEGGFPIGGLIAIGGPPKASKSTFLRLAALRHCQKGGIALLFDLEDGHFFFRKVLCHEAKLGPAGFTRGLLAHEVEAYEKAIGRSRSYLPDLHHIPPNNAPDEAHKLVPAIERVLSRAGDRPLFVVVDSLQKVPSVMEDRRSDIDKYLRLLEYVKTNYPVVLAVTSELSRAGDFKESGDIEYTADVAIRFEMDKDEAKEGESESIHDRTQREFGPKSTLRVQYNRQGRTGVVAHYRARFPYYGLEEYPLEQDIPKKGAKK